MHNKVNINKILRIQHPYKDDVNDLFSKILFLHSFKCLFVNLSLPYGVSDCGIFMIDCFNVLFK